MFALTKMRVNILAQSSEMIETSNSASKGRTGMIYHTSEWFFGYVEDAVFNIGKKVLVVRG